MINNILKGRFDYQMSFFIHQDCTAEKLKLQRIFTDQNCSGNIKNFPDRTLEVHKCYEFLFAIYGTVEYAFNGTMITLDPGSGVLIRPGIVHQRYYPTDSNANALHFWGIFSKHDLGCNCCRLENGELSIGGQYSEKNSELLYYFLKSEQRAGQQDSEILLSFFNLLLLDYLENMKQQEKQTPCKQMETIIHMIQLHIASCNGAGCSYDELSRLSGYSKSYLNHSFRRYTGMSIGEYIDFIRWQYLQE